MAGISRAKNAYELALEQAYQGHKYSDGQPRTFNIGNYRRADKDFRGRPIGYIQLPKPAHATDRVFPKRYDRDHWGTGRGPWYTVGTKAESKRETRLRMNGQIANLRGTEEFRAGTESVRAARQLGKDGRRRLGQRYQDIKPGQNRAFNPLVESFLNGNPVGDAVEAHNRRVFTGTPHPPRGQQTYYQTRPKKLSSEIAGMYAEAYPNSVRASSPTHVRPLVAKHLRNLRMYPPGARAEALTDFRSEIAASRGLVRGHKENAMRIDLRWWDE